MAHNLLHAAATMTSRGHGKARAAAVRRQMIHIAARVTPPRPRRASEAATSLALGRLVDADVRETLRPRLA